MLKINKIEIIRIIKYLFSSGSSFIIDLLLFTIFQHIFNSTLNVRTSIIIVIATILARILSSLYNYFINSRYVFQNKDKKTIIGYFILVIVQMFMSAILVAITKNYLKINATVIKFFIDIGIFIVNYIIQKNIIFRKKSR